MEQYGGTGRRKSATTDPDPSARLRRDAAPEAGSAGREAQPARSAGALVGFIGVLLAVDTQVDARAQLLLGVAAWIALALALRHATPLLRAQTLVVVAVATCAEVVGSIVWGVYTYRLENLPSFVPPCHGLVYLAGVSLALWAAPRRELLVRVTLVAVLAWGIAGVTVLPRADVGGALGAALLAVYLLRGRAPAVYAGVFLVVAWLELYGTAIGTWEWAAVDSRHGRAAGKPAERGRLRLRLLRHRRARARALAHSAGSENPTGLSAAARRSVSWRIAPSGTITSWGSPSPPCGTSVRKP